MKTKLFTSICLLTLTLFGIFGIKNSVCAEPQVISKKAILVVSFGTTYPETMKLTIEAVEKKIQQAFPDYEVRRAFTSRIIIKKLAERDGVSVDNEKQALERLKDEGYTEVIVQPLHISAGEEFEMVEETVHSYQKVFEKISLGRPILYYMGQQHKPDDYTNVIEAMQSRGYCGEHYPESDIKVRTIDICFLIAVTVICYYAYGGINDVWIFSI